MVEKSFEKMKEEYMDGTWLEMKIKLRKTVVEALKKYKDDDMHRERVLQLAENAKKDRSELFSWLVQAMNESEKLVEKYNGELEIQVNRKTNTISIIKATTDEQIAEVEKLNEKLVSDEFVKSLIDEYGFTGFEMEE